jgi:transglutaminase-like putative cysteine protease
MFFHIEHTTEYVYSEPATEAFSELRLRPRDSHRQKVSRHSTQVQPSVLVESYLDYFANYVESISIPFRHNKLVVTSVCDVATQTLKDPLSGLDLSLSEARQIFGERRREVHDFLRSSHYVQFTPELHAMSRELLPPVKNFAEAMKDLNSHIHKSFKYQPGATDVKTSVPEFLKVGKGVCQDFAHLMTALCRLAGIPARYVSGYIESENLAQSPDEAAPAQLIGAAASHAWVEVYTPNHCWVGFDPTNNIMEGEHHVQVGIGRDYHDVPPLRGVFKGRKQQSLSVQVRVIRTQLAPESGMTTET